MNESYFDFKFPQLVQFPWEKRRELGSISPTCLRAVFTHADTKRAKKRVKSSVFVLWGSVRVKAVRKTLVKSTFERRLLMHCERHFFLILGGNQFCKQICYIIKLISKKFGFKAPLFKRINWPVQNWISWLDFLLDLL